MHKNAGLLKNPRMEDDTNVFAYLSWNILMMDVEMALRNNERKRYFGVFGSGDYPQYEIKNLVSDQHSNKS